MNFLGLNISFNRNSNIANQKSAEVPLSEAALRWLRGEDVPRSPSLANAYEQVVWVYRAINVLAEQVANIPFLFSAGQRGRENLITSGPLIDFYNHPHPHIDRFQYWELRVMWLLLRGECFRIPVYATRRAGRRVLKSILILDPDRFHHIVQDNELMGWRYTGLSHNSPMDSQVLLPEEVWYERLPNPYDFWRGMSPLAVATLAASTDFTAANFMRGLLENNADLGVIVKTAQPLDEKQRAQLHASLVNRKRRAGTADDPLIVWSGAEIVKPQISSADLQFLENRKFSRAEICAAFGVPEEIVTVTDNAKYDVMAGSRLNFIENRVAPLCARLEAAENVTTIPALSSSLNPQPSTLNRPVGWFDIDSLPIMQEARRTRLQSAKAGFDMGVPFNELNKVLDLGFKPLPWGNCGFLRANLQPLGSRSPTNPHEQSAQVPLGPGLGAAGGRAGGPKREVSLCPAPTAQR